MAFSQQGGRLLDRQVGNDQAVETGGGRIVHVAIRPDAVDDRIRDHRYERRLVDPCRAFGAKRAQSLKDVRDLDSALERSVIAGGDYRTISDRVGIGNPHLDQVRASIDQLGDQERRRRQVGVAGGHERHEGAAVFGAELGEEGVDAIHGQIGSPRSRATSYASLSPRPERQTARTLPLPRRRASLKAWANAWLDSRAGRMPSCRAVTL